MLRRTLYRGSRPAEEEAERRAAANFTEKKSAGEKKYAKVDDVDVTSAHSRGEQRARAMLLTTYTYIRIQEYMTVYIYYCLLKRISC